ncbi:hypothetical protein [Peptococcus niger]|uniref:Uncharacterized protein n=1 Tax=Peptococcus niger TaxID=2741 RepID=A0A1G6W084_PEPNI|nr:hypothetical protein [Peptococcus niger]SDD59231.1 hypothetical protein SAMN04489866_104193 [Peptococcus niger]
MSNVKKVCGSLLANQKAMIFLQCALIGALVLGIGLLLPDCALAAGDPGTAIQTGVKKGSGAIWKIMTAVVVPIAAVLFAWNVFRAIFGGERGMESAKRNIFTIIVVIALVLLAPVIVKQIGGWFGKGEDGGVFGCLMPLLMM